MLQMGFSLEEIQDSLVNQKYNDVMATYLLLDYRNSEVHNSQHVHPIKRLQRLSLQDVSMPELCRHVLRRRPV